MILIFIFLFFQLTKQNIPNFKFIYNKEEENIENFNLIYYFFLLIFLILIYFYFNFKINKKNY